MSVDRLTCSEVEAFPTPDGDLLDRFTMFRDEAAFRELVVRHSRLVMGVCRRVLRCRHDAEDAYQATFLVLARGAGRIRRGESIAAWLYGTAYRVARRIRDKRARRREVSLPEGIAVQGDLLAELARRCDREAFDEELSRLPAKYREPLVLHYLLAKTARETAAELGLTVRAVEGRLRRGKSELRYRLLRRGVSLALIGAAAAKGQTTQAAVATTLVDNTIATGLTYATGNVTSDAAILAAEELSAMSTCGVPSFILAAAVAVCLLLGGVEPSHVQNTAASEQLNFRYSGSSAMSGLTDHLGTFTAADSTDASSETPQSPDANDAADREAPELPANEVDAEENALPGRIYLHVHLGIPAVDGIDRVLGVVGVDPNTGEWEVVSGARSASLRILPGGKHAFLRLRASNADENRLVLFDMQTKTCRELGAYWSSIPSRDGKAAIATQVEFPESNREGLVLATGAKYWRLKLDTLEKEPLAIPREHMLLDASGDLRWCLTLFNVFSQTEGQSNIQKITQRIIVMKTDGSETRPLIAGDDARHSFGCFAPSGEEVAYISHSPEQKSSIRLVDFDGKNVRTLYQSKHIAHFPESLCWSPDGQKLVAIIDEHAEGEHNYRLLIIDANSGAQRELILKDARAISLRHANWQ